jgi:hypothetical protein
MHDGKIDRIQAAFETAARRLQYFAGVSPQT